jgi:hypothetical protein
VFEKNLKLILMINRPPPAVLESWTKLCYSFVATRLLWYSLKPLTNHSTQFEEDNALIIGRSLPTHRNPHYFKSGSQRYWMNWDDALQRFPIKKKVNALVCVSGLSPSRISMLSHMSCPRLLQVALRNCTDLKHWCFFYSTNWWVWAHNVQNTFGLS